MIVLIQQQRHLSKRKAMEICIDMIWIDDDASCFFTKKNMVVTVFVVEGRSG